MKTIEQVISEGRAARRVGVLANPYSAFRGDSREIVDAWHKGWVSGVHSFYAEVEERRNNTVIGD